MFEKEMDAKNDNAVIKNSSTQHKKVCLHLKERREHRFLLGEIHRRRANLFLHWTSFVVCQNMETIWPILHTEATLQSGS